MCIRDRCNIILIFKSLICSVVHLTRITQHTYTIYTHPKINHWRFGGVFQYQVHKMQISFQTHESLLCRERSQKIFVGNSKWNICYLTYFPERNHKTRLNADSELCFNPSIVYSDYDCSNWWGSEERRSTYLYQLYPEPRHVTLKLCNLNLNRLWIMKSIFRGRGILQGYWARGHKDVCKVRSLPYSHAKR